MTSFQEAPTNEPIVEIDEKVKGQLVDAKGASTPPGMFKFDKPRSKI